MPGQAASTPPEMNTPPPPGSPHGQASQPSLSVGSRQPPVVPVNFPSADLPAIDLTHKLQIAEESSRDADGESDAAAADRWEHAAQTRTATRSGLSHSVPQIAASEPTHTDSPMPRSDDGMNSADALHATEDRSDDHDSHHQFSTALESTDAIHQHLIHLSPSELCRALGKVETRQAMLTLCGLPNAVTQSVLAILPRAEARKVRIKMNALGSLHLREIDEAKERVARISLENQTASSSQTPVAA